MLCITGALIQEGLKLLFVEFLIKETRQVSEGKFEFSTRLKITGDSPVRVKNMARLGGNKRRISD